MKTKLSVGYSFILFNKFYNNYNAILKTHNDYLND